MWFWGLLGDFEGFLKRFSAFGSFLCIRQEERQPLLAMKRSWSSSDDSEHRAPDDLAALATATPLRPNALSVAASVFDDSHAVDDEASGAASGAEPVQQSLAPLPVWESTACATNRELDGLSCLVSPHGLHGRLELTQATAVHDFCVSEREATLVHNYLVDRWNRDDHGFLTLGHATFAGYGDYQLVEVKKWNKNIAPASQESFSTSIPQSSIQFVIDTMPGLEPVVRRIFRQLQLDFRSGLKCLKMLHFLVQADPHVRLWPFEPFAALRHHWAHHWTLTIAHTIGLTTELTVGLRMCTWQAVFSWHNDASDLKLTKNMLTVIVSLNSNESGLQLRGFEPLWYTRAGAAVAFRGQAVHRTVMPSAASMPESFGGNMHTCSTAVLARAPVKMAMFLDFVSPPGMRSRRC